MVYPVTVPRRDPPPRLGETLACCGVAQRRPTSHRNEPTAGRNRSCVGPTKSGRPRSPTRIRRRNWYRNPAEIVTQTGPNSRIQRVRAVLGGLGDVRAGFGGYLGGLGASWARLGPLGALLGSSRGGLGGLLGAFMGASWGRFGASWGRLGVSRSHPGGVLGGFGAVWSGFTKCAFCF